MQNNSYSFVPQGGLYTFTSIGKRRIEKQVRFKPTGIRNIVNLGFGDLRPDGSIDDKVNSNNGDIVRVLATVVKILLDFMSRYPDAEIFFAGSTQERTKLYTRILRTHYDHFNKQFKIKAIITEGDRHVVLPFEPGADLKFVGFLIQRNY